LTEPMKMCIESRKFHIEKRDGLLTQGTEELQCHRCPLSKECSMSYFSIFQYVFF